MANYRSAVQSKLSISHLPSYLLFIGYGAFWLELYFISSNRGHTSYLAWGLWSCLALFLIILRFSSIKETLKTCWSEWQQLSRLTKFLTGSSMFLVGLMLTIGLYAHLFPPHLIQEHDVLNYHISLPRQHIIRESFALIPWATADLYFLPVDLALAPYWLATPYPNKLPQFFFVIGLLLVSAHITRQLGGGLLSSIAVVAAIMGTHSVGIQMGLGMIDLVICYLFIASLDSLLKRDYLTASAEFTFFFWSKSFIPIQWMLIVCIFVILFVILRKFKFDNVQWGFQDANSTFNILQKKQMMRLFLLFFVLSIAVAGPFMAKSIKHAGTPIFPFQPYIIQVDKDLVGSEKMEVIQNKAARVRETRDQYGSGRSLKDFLVHLWLIAVPEKELEVNNRYDYPVGLPYLLFVIPFFYLSCQMLQNKKIGILALFIFVYWGIWWLGTHQTRFLYIPLILMFISVCSCSKILTNVLMAMIMVALLSTTRSMIGAHKSDFGKKSYEVLRNKDKKLLALNKTVKDGQVETLTYPDVAFADFLVNVENSSSIFVLE